MKNHSQVCFPCIHLGAVGELVKISCSVNDEIRGPIKSIGLNDDIIEKVIGACRYNEHTKEVTKSIFVRVSNPNFYGRSYELALAVVDKLSRYDCYNKNKMYIATGTIDADGCGKVSAIKNMHEKLLLILKKVKPNALVFIPLDNVDLTNEVQQNLFTKIRNKGAELHFIENVLELGPVLGIASAAKVSQKQDWLIKQFKSRFLLFVFVMVLIALSIFFDSNPVDKEFSIDQEVPINAKNTKEKHSEKYLLRPIEVPTDHY